MVSGRGRRISNEVMFRAHLPPPANSSGNPRLGVLHDAVHPAGGMRRRADEFRRMEVPNSAAHGSHYVHSGSRVPEEQTSMDPGTLHLRHCCSSKMSKHFITYRRRASGFMIRPCRGGAHADESLSAMSDTRWNFEDHELLVAGYEIFANLATGLCTRNGVAPRSVLRQE